MLKQIANSDAAMMISQNTENMTGCMEKIDVEIKWLTLQMLDGRCKCILDGLNKESGVFDFGTRRKRICCSVRVDRTGSRRGREYPQVSDVGK